MLADTLSGNRIFVIANRAASALDQIAEQSPPCSIATVGIIRMSNLKEDGTSHVILQGISRVRIEAIVQETPYRLVKIQPLLPSETPSNSDQLQSLQQTLLALIDERERLGTPCPEGFREMFDSTQNLDAAADLTAHALCKDSALKQTLLETFDTARRLNLIIEAFRRELEKCSLDQKLDELRGEDNSQQN